MLFRSLIGTCTLAAGTCQIDRARIPVGIPSIGATYDGDAAYAVSTSTGAPLTVTQSATTTKLKSSKATMKAGLAIAFTATVTGAGVGAVPPDGSITLRDQSKTGKVIGRCTLRNGACTVKTKKVSVGRHVIWAIYAGTTNYLASSGSARQTVVAGAGSSGPGRTTATASVLADASGPGGIVSVDVTVGGRSSCWGGRTVTILLDEDGDGVAESPVAALVTDRLGSATASWMVGDLVAFGSPTIVARVDGAGGCAGSSVVASRPEPAPGT